MVARVAVSLLTDREVSRSSQMPAVCQSQALLSLFTDYGSKQAQHLASEASCMQISHWLVSTLHPVSCPSSAALMPADGTVDNSIVKQSANGGNVDVDNGDAACIAPVTVCKSVLCLVRIGAMIVLPLLSCRCC